MNEALEESIKHWERILTGEDTSANSKSCPLCQKHEYCETCIIMIHTGQGECADTPYWYFIYHLYSTHSANEWHIDTVTQCKKCQKLVQNEIDFLKSLRKRD